MQVDIYLEIRKELLKITKSAGHVLFGLHQYLLGLEDTGCLLKLGIVVNLEVVLGTFGL